MLKLKELREKHSISQLKLANCMGVSRSTIAMWETGGSQPDVESLIRLSEIFDTSVDDILGNPITPTAQSNKNIIRVPVFGQVAAGIPIEAIQDIEDYEELDANTYGHGEYFALKIKGRSMEPRMLEGDVVIVRRQDNVDTGEIAIVLVNGDEATCKKIKKTPEGVFLMSTNPAFDPMFFSNKEIEDVPVRIIGKVVELRGKF